MVAPEVSSSIASAEAAHAMHNISVKNMSINEELSEALHVLEEVEHHGRGGGGAALFNFVNVAFSAALFFTVCQLRVAVRRRDLIRGTCFEDVFCSTCCFCCTLCQLMRHERLTAGNYNLCSPTGVTKALPI